jgi:hypothetical protein
MAELAVLDVLGPQRLGQERVLAQVDHAEAEVVAGAPPGLDAAEFIAAEGLAGDGGAGGGVGGQFKDFGREAGIDDTHGKLLWSKAFSIGYAQRLLDDNGLAEDFNSALKVVGAAWGTFRRNVPRGAIVDNIVRIILYLNSL